MSEDSARIDAQPPSPGQPMTEASPDSTQQPAGPMSSMPGLGILWAGIGAVGVLLTAFLVVGVLLPGTWTAERSRTLSAPPEDVYPFLSNLREWEAWTHWPELQNVQEESSGGAEMTRSWDDSNYGRGTLTLVEASANSSVRYEVRVEGGIEIDGSLVLEPAPQGATLTWTERGAFGRNPLLRYTALSMDDLQGTEMDKALDRLSELVANPR